MDGRGVIQTTTCYVFATPIADNTSTPQNLPKVWRGPKRRLISYPLFGVVLDAVQILQRIVACFSIGHHIITTIHHAGHARNRAH